MMIIFRSASDADGAHIIMDLAVQRPTDKQQGASALLQKLSWRLPKEEQFPAGEFP